MRERRKMQLLDLPLELLRQVLVQAVLARGLKRGLRLRLVCGLFAEEVEHAIYLADVIPQEDYPDKHPPPRLASVYTFYEVMAEKTDEPTYLTIIRHTADKICQELELSDQESRSKWIEKLCWLHCTQGRFENCSSLKRPNVAFDLNIYLLAAAAYFNLIPIAKRLIHEKYNVSENSQVFGWPTKAAAFQGNLEMLSLLLSEDAVGTVYGKQCRGVLGAADGGQLQALELLLLPRPNYHPPSHGFFKKFLKRGLRCGNLNIFKRVVPFFIPEFPDFPNNCHGYLLDDAAEGGHLYVAVYLLDSGAPVNGTSEQEPHQASTYLDSPICSAVRNGHYEMVNLLLERGANANPTFRGNPLRPSPIVSAATRGDLRILRVLVDYGATPDERSTPPIALAIRLEYIAMFNLLLGRGITLCTSESAENIIEYAIINCLESMIELLVDEGIIINNGGQKKYVDMATNLKHHRIAQLLRQD